MHFCYEFLGKSINMDVNTAKEIFESTKYGKESLLNLISRKFISPYGITIKVDTIDYQIEINQR